MTQRSFLLAWLVTRSAANANVRTGWAPARSAHLQLPRNEGVSGSNPHIGLLTRNARRSGRFGLRVVVLRTHAPRGLASTHGFASDRRRGPGGIRTRIFLVARLDVLPVTPRARRIASHAHQLEDAERPQKRAFRSTIAAMCSVHARRLAKPYSSATSAAWTRRDSNPQLADGKSTCVTSYTTGPPPGEPLA